MNEIKCRIWYGSSNWSSFGGVCSRVTDVGIEAVVRSCKNLRNLNISGCKVCVSPIWPFPEILITTSSLLQTLASGDRDSCISILWLVFRICKCTPFWTYIPTRTYLETRHVDRWISNPCVSCCITESGSGSAECHRQKLAYNRQVWSEDSKP